MLDETHPQYDAVASAWSKMRDCFAGEDTIKAAGQTYLPATSGQRNFGLDPGQLGRFMYDAYVARAVFPSFVSDSVATKVGVMHSKEPVIDLPSILDPLRERATLHGESLNLLLRRINEAQLLTGRFGLLLDLPSDGSADLPYVATYDAENIINWDDGRREAPTIQTLNLVVLDEGEFERNQDFQWEWQVKYRVLVLGDVSTDEATGTYRQALFRSAEFDESALMEPSIRGVTLDEIPFVFINSTDLLPNPLMPPQIELANRCLAIYRAEADYRQTRFMHGQDTLVIEGGDEERTYATGVGACITPPLGTGGQKVYFAGINSGGLPEQRLGLENDYRIAGEMGAKLLDSTSRQKESGDALNIRVAAQTATLVRIALTGAGGLEKSLKMAARWVGANEDEVKVSANLEFAEAGLSSQDLFALSQAREKGMPMTDEEFHLLLKKNGFTMLEWAEYLEKKQEEQRQNQDPVAQVNLERSKLALEADKARLSGNPAGIAERIMQEKANLQQNPPPN